MYIIFDGSDEGFFNLLFELKDWSNQHNILYKVKLHKQGIKLVLPQHDDYFYFCLTWNPERHYNYKLIEPMKIDNS